MSTSPAPLPSAPPAPEWDGHVAVAAAQAVVGQSEQPAAAAVAVAVAVAEVVPSFPNDKRNDTIPLPPATMAHYAQPLPLPVHDDDVVVNNNEHKEEEEHNRIVEHFTIDGSPGKHGSQPGQAPPGRQSSDNGPSIHGQHAGNAAPGLRGEDGGIVDVSVSMANASETGKIIVEGSVQKNGGGAQPPPPLTTTHFAPVTTDFNVSARGGNGGRGGRGGHGGAGAAGSKGRNASRYYNGHNGGPGGNGGHAGTGTDGGGGGTGGTITIRISDPDSYYLMAFPCCHRDPSLNLAVSGGDPGLKGTHGRPGMPGQGGRGGHSYTWTTTEGSGDNQRTVHHHNPGGQSGPDGIRGMAVTQPLYNGNRGDDGKLTIHVDDSHQYDCRYDLLLSTASIQTPQQLQEHRHVFQFTDSIQITNMTCQNVGGMISPIQGSNIHFKVQQQQQEELTIIPNLKTMGWFHTRLAPDEIGSIQGKLSFHVKPPNIRTLGYDMEPYRVKEKLYLAATQLGPYGFRRTYPYFHADGIMMDFRFPVENWTKLEGLPTICAGEGTHVKFCVNNTSLRDLGMQSRDGRKLVVQFYKNSHEDYDVESCHIDLRVEGVECSMSDDNGVGLWRGTSFEIDHLAAGQTKTFEGTLKLSPQVTPYSRLGVQAEILLEELGKNDNDLNEANLRVPKMMPVQRRQLEVSSEPTYMPFKENHVVLVSCATTRKDQFNAWSDLLTQRLGLGVEYYSVSIYGSLDPTFRPPNGSMDLAQAFKGKLVVVLDDTFNPLGKSVSEMEPSRMLPNGSQPQTSGYDKSTRWLLAGSTDDAVKQALVSHFTAPPNDATNFSSLSEFKKNMKENLKKERKEGCVLDEHICEFAISVKDERCWMNPAEKSIDRKAKDVKSFLEKMDPLRQYIIEPQGELTKDDDGVSYQQLVVRRGYCRTANRTHVLKMAIPPKENDGNAILAVVGALPLDTLILVFDKAVSAKDELVIEVALDIFTQHLLWEVSNVLEGRLNVRKTEDLNAVFPTLTAISLSSDLKQISGGTGNDGIKALSKLLARLECIANSQDLKPGPLPMSLRRAVRKTLLKMVAALKKEWVGIISEEDRLKEMQMIRNNVLDHLRKTYGILAFPRVKKASRWRKGLLHICSYRNKDKYEDAGFCGPAVRLCEMETLEHTIKSRAIAPSKTIATEDNCRSMRQQADKQKKMASQLLKSIEETRDELGLGDGGEIEVQLPHNTSYSL